MSCARARGSHAGRMPGVPGRQLLEYAHRRAAAAQRLGRLGGLDRTDRLASGLRRPLRHPDHGDQRQTARQGPLPVRRRERPRAVPAEPAYPHQPASDRHAIVLHKPSCRLFETWNTKRTAGGWTAGSGATWNLRSNRLRPRTWTSADAAGLPILPGLLRWSEVRKGEVRHAIRFTAPTTAPTFIWPARHQAGDDPAAPPMGARFRLRAGFDVSGYSARTRVVITAMQRYGLVLADNGTGWYFQGATSSRWPDRLIAELKTIPSSAFEAVNTSGLMRSPNSARTQTPPFGGS